MKKTYKTNEMKKTPEHFRKYSGLYALILVVIFWAGFENFCITLYEIFMQLKDICMQLMNKKEGSAPSLDTQISAINSLVSFAIAIVGLRFFYRRITNQDKQIKLQIDQRVDERFTTAVNLLGSSESSARTGAIYALYHLAVDGEKYRRQIAQILCSHIRSKTQEGDYQGKLKEDNHKERPSNEIQTCINLLFKPKSEGLYTKYAADLDEADLDEADLDEADLSHAYLVGADFSEVRFQGARFSDTQCQGADFSAAHCQGANFSSAHCQGANFSLAQCESANFIGAQCQGANFRIAQCQGANFSDAQCQSANFCNAQCQGADFSNAQCQGAIFRRTQCQGANFFDAQCQGANFSEAQCQGANFGRAQCQGANFSEAQCQSADFSDAQCQGAYFFDAECQGANFFDAECQGANFSSAECQGADFLNTDLKGAYALGGVSRTKLAGRVGKDTELQNMVFVGRLEAEAITQIKAAKEYISDNEYQKLEEIIEAHKDNETDCTAPDGIITGVLENSEEIQAVIAKDWDKFKELQKYKY